MKPLNLGLLPAAGGSLMNLAQAGQVERLTNYYFPAYLQSFRHLFYFSYQQEKLSDYTRDPKILNHTTLVPKLKSSPYRAYACQLPFIARKQLQACQVLRVFQATGAVPAMLARLLYGLPYITTYGYKYHAFADVEGHHLSRLYLRILEPLALRLAAGVIVTTQELVDYVGRYVKPGKIHLIPNGVDTTLFAPAEDLQEHNDRQKTILFIGRLTQQKNLPHLLEALKYLTQKFSIQLQIIGDGPLGADLAEMATRLQVACTFVGTVPHRTLPGYMNQANLFVLPSLIEGHPKVLIEAMSCGMTCVASNCQGNRLVLEDEKTGLLFDPTNVQHMANQIERVLTNQTLARTLGRAARQYVEVKYNLDQLLQQETALLYKAGR